MESPDSVERTQYLTRDRVHHLKEASKDKDRPFSKALREKMEEDLDDQRKRRQRDTVELQQAEAETHDEPSDEARDESADQETQQASEPEGESESPDDGAADGSEKPPDTTSRIDLKA